MDVILLSEIEEKLKGATYYISILQWNDSSDTGICSNLKISYSITADTGLI